MENLKYTEKLAKYALYAAVCGIIAFLCWYFSNVLIYIIAAVIVSLLARPIMDLLQKVNIKGVRIPDWISAVLSLTAVIGGILCIVTLIVPIASGIAKGISMANVEAAAAGISDPLNRFNAFLTATFPKLGNGFRIEAYILSEVSKIFDVTMFSSALGSAASFITSIGIGLFSVVFIGFFFTKDKDLFGKMISAIVPDKHEENARTAISDIGHLLSRYFSGVAIEMFGVGLINFIGLYFIARMGFNTSIGIAFITGILNIIPYLGPLLGGIIGTILALVVKYSSIAPIGLEIGFGWFTLILIAIFCFTQLVDNFLYQPLIYSSSIKARPLEIFIVLLIAGHLAGPMGMIVAIPAYTVIRVVAFRFFGHIKAIQRLENK